jgi:hypothetical protein
LQYILFVRINGRRFSNVNGVETQESAFSSALTARVNTQLCTRSNSVDGTVKTGFGKGLQGICAMDVGPQGSIDKAKVVATVQKLMREMYGVGV